ncbi:unnamed protein product [Amoebophrya sp. A25]|nr:unnamed protein product [Amoebophrya sp. A25]|eukprot:GSA25T00017837001.1
MAELQAQVDQLTADLAAANAQIVVLNGAAQINNFQQVAAEEGGLGVPTEAQKEQLSAALTNLDYGCSSKEFLFMRRCFMSERMEDSTITPAAITWSPLSYVAALRVVEVLTDDQARTLQKLVIKEVAGPLGSSKQIANEVQLDRAVIFGIFFETVAIILKKENRPTVANDPPATFYQRTMRRAFVVNLPVFFKQKLDTKKTMVRELAEIKKASAAEMEITLRTLRAEIATLKRAQPINNTDKEALKSRRPNSNPSAKVCLKWMKGECRDKKCEAAHEGDLSKLAFLNTRFKLKLDNKKLTELAAQEK